MRSRSRSGGAPPSAPAGRATRGAALSLVAALLPRSLRHSRLVPISLAFGRWIMLVHGAGRRGGAEATRALKRASAQELALHDLKAERDALAAELAARDRQLTVCTRQLAYEKDRRRALDAGSKSAHGQLRKLLDEAGKQRARDTAAVEARASQVEWRDEAVRTAAERAILQRELIYLSGRLARRTYGSRTYT